MRNHYLPILSVLILTSCQNIPNISEDIGDIDTYRGNEAIPYNEFHSNLQLQAEVMVSDPCDPSGNSTILKWQDNLRANGNWIVERYNLGDDLDDSFELSPVDTTFNDHHRSNGIYKYVVTTRVTGDSVVSYSENTPYIGVRGRWIEGDEMRGWNLMESPVYSTACSHLDFNWENVSLHAFKTGAGYVLFKFNNDALVAFQKETRDSDWTYTEPLNYIRSGKLVKVSDDEILLYSAHSANPEQAINPISRSRNYIYNTSSQSWSQIGNIELPDDENIYLSNDHSASVMENGKIVFSSYGYHIFSSEKYDRRFDRTVISVYDPATSSFTTSQLQRNKIFFKTTYVGDGKLMGFTGLGMFVNNSRCDPCLEFRTPYNEVSIYDIEEHDIIHTEFNSVFNEYNYNPVKAAIVYDNQSKVLITFQGGETVVYDLNENQVNVGAGDIPEDFTGIARLTDGRIMGLVSGWFASHDLGWIYEFNQESEEWEFFEEMPFKEQPMQILGNQDNELIVYMTDSGKDNEVYFYFFSKKF